MYECLFSEVPFAAYLNLFLLVVPLSHAKMFSKRWKPTITTRDPRHDEIKVYLGHVAQVQKRRPVE